MGEITFNTSNADFRELVKKSKNYASDGIISAKEEADLRKIAAESGGETTKEEEDYINSLTGKHTKERDFNINTLVLTKISDSEPVTIKFKTRDSSTVSTATKVARSPEGSGNHLEKVNFDSSEKSFTDLAKMARGFASDGEINESEKNQLIKFASDKDGGITPDEEKFIKALTGKHTKQRDNNINTLVRSKIKDGEALNLTFEVLKPNKVSERASPNLDNTGYANPNNAEIVDVGAVLEDKMKLSPETLIKKISNEFKQNVPESFSKLISKFSDDSEALSFILALSSSKLRTPEQKEQIARKIGEMASETNYDARIGDVNKFVISALHDAALPQDISQAGLTSCAGTTIQIKMSLTRPMDYLNMVDSLAKGKNYTAPGGAVIEPNWSFVNDGKGRSLASGLAQNAIMDFANGKDKGYNSSVKDPDGLSGTQEVKALKGIFGGNFKFVTGLEKVVQESEKKIEEMKKGNNNTPPVDSSPAAVKNNLIQSLIDAKPSLGNPIPSSVNYRAPGTTASAEHAVLVFDVKAKGPDDPAGTVRYINPWGRVETTSLNTFKEMMYGANIVQ